MARAEISTVVNRPVEEVFQFVANLENDPIWHPRCLASQKITDGPIGVGSRFREIYAFMGKSEIIMEITEFELHKKVAFRGTPTGPMEPADAISLEPVDGGTRVTYVAQPRTRGPFKLLDPLLSLSVKRELQKVMAELERALP